MDIWPDYSRSSVAVRINFSASFEAPAHQRGWRRRTCRCSSTRFWAVLLQNSVFGCWWLMPVCFYLRYYNGHGWLADCLAPCAGSYIKCSSYFRCCTLLLFCWHWFSVIVQIYITGWIKMLVAADTILNGKRGF